MNHLVYFGVVYLATLNIQHKKKQSLYIPAVTCSVYPDMAITNMIHMVQKTPLILPIRCIKIWTQPLNTNLYLAMKLRPVCRSNYTLNKTWGGLIRICRLPLDSTSINYVNYPAKNFLTKQILKTIFCKTRNRKLEMRLIEVLLKLPEIWILSGNGGLSLFTYLKFIVQ